MSSVERKTWPSGCWIYMWVAMAFCGWSFSRTNLQRAWDCCGLLERTSPSRLVFVFIFVFGFVKSFLFGSLRGTEIGTIMHVKKRQTPHHDVCEGKAGRSLHTRAECRDPCNCEGSRLLSEGCTGVRRTWFAMKLVFWRWVWRKFQQVFRHYP